MYFSKYVVCYRSVAFFSSLGVGHEGKIVLSLKKCHNRRFGAENLAGKYQVD